MADLTNLDLIFCSNACRDAGRESLLRLQSVGFLSKLRAVSYVCDACGHPTVVSVRRGSVALPRPSSCWNCAVTYTGAPECCASCDAHLNLGAGHADGLLFAYGRAELAELSTHGPAQLEALLRRARAERRVAEAVRVADALTRVAPDVASAWRHKAELYLEHGFLTLALASYKRALLLEPDDVDMVLGFANVVELLDELEIAAEHIDHAARLAPEDARPPAMLAALFDKLERPEDAQAAAERALQLDPQRADAWATLATLHMRRRDFTLAQAAWRSVLAAAPDFPLAWRYLGMCHLYLEQWSEAVAAGRSAGEGDDEALEITFEGLLAGGDATTALTHAMRCGVIRPDDTRFLYLQARAHLSLGTYPAGLEVIDRILELAPDSGWAKQARQTFEQRLGPAQE